MNPILNLKTLVRPGTNTLLVLDEQFGQGGWCYVGWANRRYGLATSPLANPYTPLTVSRSSRIRVAGRDVALSAYRVWLWTHITTGNRAILTAFQAITPDMVLVCWYAPLACHAEVVVRAAAWVRAQPYDAELPLLARTLDRLLQTIPNPIIVSGRAKGADQYGEAYARTHGIACERYPADWKQHGRSAGFRRNQELVP